MFDINCFYKERSVLIVMVAILAEVTNSPVFTALADYHLVIVENEVIFLEIIQP